MSERKSTEIKFRVAPTFKARVQTAAAAEEVSLSEFIVAAVESYLTPGYAYEYEFVHTNTDPPKRDVVISNITDVPTSGEVGSKEEQTYPWAFEAKHG